MPYNLDQVDEALSIFNMNWINVTRILIERFNLTGFIGTCLATPAWFKAGKALEYLEQGS